MSNGVPEEFIEAYKSGSYHRLLEEERIKQAIIDQENAALNRVEESTTISMDLDVAGLYQLYDERDTRQDAIDIHAKLDQVFSVIGKYGPDEQMKIADKVSKELLHGYEIDFTGLYQYYISSGQMPFLYDSDLSLKDNSQARLESLNLYTDYERQVINSKLKNMDSSLVDMNTVMHGGNVDLGNGNTRSFDGDPWKSEKGKKDRVEAGFTDILGALLLGADYGYRDERKTSEEGKGVYNESITNLENRSAGIATFHEDFGSFFGAGTNEVLGISEGEEDRVYMNKGFWDYLVPGTSEWSDSYDTGQPFFESNVVPGYQDIDIDRIIPDEYDINALNKEFTYYLTNSKYMADPDNFNVVSSELESYNQDWEYVNQKLAELNLLADFIRREREQFGTGEY